MTIKKYSKKYQALIDGTNELDKMKLEVDYHFFEYEKK